MAAHQDHPWRAGRSDWVVDSKSIKHGLSAIEPESLLCNSTLAEIYMVWADTAEFVAKRYR